MESLVVTFKTANKLKAAGFPQDTYFRWAENKDATPRIWTIGTTHPSFTLIAAPTAQDIADQLPLEITITDDKEYNFLEKYKTKKRTEIEYQVMYKAGYRTALNDDGSTWETSQEADTMAEALALLWLKLQETKQ